ncbi:hypothetical protein J7337_005073 [Fusarium musae]|uniref:Apple domain-containing protein n=1 Tax=Fusarium musae TaxID=1042133 RepID=A0A9P8DHV1_9HYPO|nr:hypothetical protein J7337_005073 [Fusarium musae]KAG9502247.1 hypothetical protein J7337_005073 [Fusarium musae]
MKTTIAMLTASMATAILAHPFDTRSQQCNIAPSASPSTKIQPLSSPTASTAQACQKLCTAHASCKSFLFGLPTDAKAPTCKLYSVPAAQVPNQGNNLYVFDKACSEKAVPNTKPTEDKPRGEVKVRVERDDKPHGKPPVEDQDHAGDKPPKNKAPVNPPNNKRDNKPKGKPPVDGKPPAGDKGKGKAPVNPPNNKRGIKPEDKPHGDYKPKAPLPPKDKNSGKHN